VSVVSTSITTALPDMHGLFESRAFLDSLRQGVLLYDDSGRVVDANLAALAILDVTRQQLLGIEPTQFTWRTVAHDGSVLAAEDHPAMVTLRTRQPCVDATVGFDREGAERKWFSVSTFPLMRDELLVGVSALFADVTASLALRHELQMTVERLEILGRHPADIVVLASQDAVAEWVTDSVTGLLGYMPDEVVGQRIDHFVHPDDLASIIEFRKSAPDAESASFLVRLRRRDGEYRWISISARRFTDPVTQASRIVSSWRDAQALVEARTKLKESETRFRFLAENASDIVCETTSDFVVTWISTSVTEILGWQPQQVIGRPLLDFVISEDKVVASDERARLEAGEKSHNIKFRAVSVTGAERWMMGRARLIHRDDGGETVIVVALRDIHEEELIRSELEVTQERYRLLAENDAYMTILLDSDYVYRWVSPSSSELIGYAPSEMVGKTSRDFVHPDDYARLLSGRVPTSSGEHSFEDIRIRKADGTQGWISGRMRDVFGDNGQIIAHVASIRDVAAQVATEKALLASESRLRLILENQLDVTAMFDSEGIVEWVTPSVQHLLGWTDEEMVGRRVIDLINQSDIPAFTQAMDDVTAGHAISYEGRVHSKAGIERWVAVRAQPLFDDDGATIGSIANIRDIHNEHVVRTQLAQSEEQFRLAMLSAPIGMAVLDLDRRFLAVNPALCEMLARSPDWLLQHSVPDILDPADEELDSHMRTEALSGRVIHSSRQMRFLLEDGTSVWAEHAIGLLHDEDDSPRSFVSTFVDVTQTKLAQDKLRYQATHDALTNLVNRRDLYLRAERLQRHTLRSGNRVGVLYIDVDHFKEINDAFGHHGGDATLRVVAERLTKLGRSTDVISRVGGDEFVVLLTALHTVDDATSFATKILEAFREPIATEGVVIPVSVSIGVALAEQGESPDATFRRADNALYQAKVRGRARVVAWEASYD
jgi:diguanylate cyclase (GGDEF)-like protein/PAS domain S-box-containing protein